MNTFSAFSLSGITATRQKPVFGRICPLVAVLQYFA
jgi:hypothetical protein